MKKRLYNNLIVNHLEEHSSVYLFVVVLFSMGVIFGAIVVNSLSFTQKEDLFYYLSQFFTKFSSGEVMDDGDLFVQSLFHNSKFIGLIWILGISLIGLPIILIILFIKGMVVGFTVGFLVNQMGWSGFLLSFVAILPQNLLIVPIFIITAALSIIISLKMIRKQFMKTNNQPIMPIFVRYITSLIVALSFLVIAAAIEAYVSPLLMKAVISSLGYIRMF